MKSRRLYWLVVLVAVLVASALYFGPHWTVYRMRKAIEARDAAGFSSQVDFPALKESVKAQLKAKMGGMFNSSDMKDNPLAGLGQVIGSSLINQTVDAMVTPTGVMVLMQQGKLITTPGASPSPSPPPQPQPQPNESSTDAPPRYAIHFLDFSTVEIRARDGSPAKFILRRDNVFFWKLSAVELPM